MASKVHFDVQGPNGAPSVLLSSGLGGTAGFWQPQMSALLDAGYRVITYDQHGTGRSQQLLSEPYSIQQMALDVVEILDASNTNSCQMVGHALGGLVALQLALNAPARLDSLVLINAWSKPNPHSARCFDSRLTLLAVGGPKAYVAAQPIFLYPAAWCAANQQRVEEEVAHGTAHFQGEANLRARISALRFFDIDARLGEIKLPVLVSTAQDDILVPWTCSERLAQGLPLAQLDKFAHGGHGHNVTEAIRFNSSLLDFLDKHSVNHNRPVQ
jgi:aminoacrylate hydrolase